jgi:hypothetical protein
LVVAFKTWGELVKKARHSGSTKNAIRYFLEPPGWSHDGREKTVVQMRNERAAQQQMDHPTGNKAGLQA